MIILSILKILGYWFFHTGSYTIHTVRYSFAGTKVDDSASVREYSLFFGLVRFVFKEIFGKRKLQLQVFGLKSD
jgi:hypothetical protein